MDSITKTKDTFNDLANELTQVVHELDKWYDIGKVRWYMVDVYTKGHDSKPPYSDSIFDIFEDEIKYYDDVYVMPSEVAPIVFRIQDQMKKISNYFDI